MQKLTPLEHAILERFVASSELRQLLATANVTERENTGHGFYTTLSVNRTLPPVDLQPMIDGPSVYLDGREAWDTIETILWLEGGYPVTLEGFQYGDFDLRTVDLADLKFERIEWRDANASCARLSP